MTPQAFRAARADLGLTQKQLANKIGYTWQMISLYENGHQPVPKVVRLALQALSRP